MDTSGSITISSLVIHLDKLVQDEQQACMDRLRAVPGLDIVQTVGQYRLAATLEAASTQQSAKLVQSIEKIDGVQMVQLIYCQTNI